MMEQPPKELDYIHHLDPLFASVEEFLKVSWQDPRYAVRVMVNLMRTLRDPDTTMASAMAIMIEDVPPVKSL